MVDREREHAVAVALERFPGAHLDELERIRELSEHAPEAREELARPAGP